MTKLVMVEVLSTFRHRYVVEVEENLTDAVDEFVLREDDIDFQEFSQTHLKPITLLDTREISREEYLRMFDEDNDYLAAWTEEQKLAFINKINYEEDK